MPSSCACSNARDLLELAAAAFGAEVDGRADPDTAHVERLLHAREHDLVELVRVGDELAVVELEDEGDLVGVALGDRTEHAEGARDAVAPARDRELDDVLGVEVDRVGREARTGGVFDALVDRQDRDVAGVAEPTVSEECLQIAQHGSLAVRVDPDAVEEIGTGSVQHVLGDGLAGVAQQGFAVLAE